MNRNGKRLLSLLLWIMLAIAASGCWNRRELNELSVVLAMGIDQVGDQYEISLQTVDPSQMGRNRKTERSPTTVYSERAPTLFEAIRKITTKASRRMYGSHLHLLLFDENVARAGIRRTLDLMLRDHEVKARFSRGRRQESQGQRSARNDHTYRGAARNGIVQVIARLAKNVGPHRIRQR
ncbi:hypothetical protein [Paenibacillus ginsengihumi]|uniref:Ger(x)C family spore germination protein n=1 Tax=Paenibacillus ginsengihumi TaxID=431596 RepID=UPI00039F139A|nr:hypothetical protein [Paenibacillus ginsengihumi]